MCVKQNNNSVIVNITGVNPVIYDMMPEYLGLFLALYSRIRALQLSNGRSMRLLAHGIYVGRDWSDLAFLYAGIALFLVYVAVVKWRVTPTTSQTSIGCVPNVDGGQNCFAAVAGQPEGAWVLPLITEIGVFLTAFSGVIEHAKGLAFTSFPKMPLDSIFLAPHKRELLEEMGQVHTFVHGPDLATQIREHFHLSHNPAARLCELITVCLDFKKMDKIYLGKDVTDIDVVAILTELQAVGKLKSSLSVEEVQSNESKTTLGRLFLWYLGPFAQMKSQLSQVRGEASSASHVVSQITSAAASR